MKKRIIISCILICTIFSAASVFASPDNHFLATAGYGTSMYSEDKQAKVSGLDLGIMYVHDTGKPLSVFVISNTFLPIISDGGLYSGRYETESFQNTFAGIAWRVVDSRFKARLGIGLNLELLEAERGEAEWKRTQLTAGIGTLINLQYTFSRHFSICLNGGLSYYFGGIAGTTPYRGEEEAKTVQEGKLSISASIGLGYSF